MTGAAILGAAVALAFAWGCGDPSAPTGADSPVHTLEVVGGSGQVVTGGRRSPEPFRVRALDASGAPVPDREVRFRTVGAGGGILSQPTALTDDSGVAATFLLKARAGEGEVRASAGRGEAVLPFRVERAPGRIVFDETPGREGLPSLPHPDSLVAVTLFDTDGFPLGGWPVFFAAEGELVSFVDTTDASGRAYTRLRRSGPAAGDGVVFAFIPAFPEALAFQPRRVRAPARRVLVVSVDGLRGDALALYAPPVLTALSEGGAWTDRALTVLPSLSVPAHLSMLAGVPPSEHGVHSDRMQITQEMSGLDPLFRRARRGGAAGAAVMSREGPLSGFGEILECRQAFGLDRLVLTGPTAAEAVVPALEALADSTVSLVFVHLPDPDRAGHQHGWLSPEYREAVLTADAALGILVQAAHAPGSPPTLILVTAPHGGGGAYGPFQHGSGSPEDMEVPLILNGAGVARGGRLQASSILDVAPTVLWALGIPPPVHYRGRVLLEAAGSPGALGTAGPPW